MESRPLMSTGAVTPLKSCQLTVEPPEPSGRYIWTFADTNAAAIDAHWQRAVAANPKYFDGTVFVMTANRTLRDGHFSAQLRPVKFRAFLYWRDHGMTDGAVYDCFGSAIVRARDGGVLLGRQTAGNINAGRTYLPGGFIDPRDVAPDGSVDVAANVTRELAEETGLEINTLNRESGFYLTEIGQQVSLGVSFRVDNSAADIARQIRRHIAAEAAPELADVMFADAVSDLASVDVPEYAQLILAHVLRSQGARTKR